MPSKNQNDTVTEGIVKDDKKSAKPAKPAASSKSAKAKKSSSKKKPIDSLQKPKKSTKSSTKKSGGAKSKSTKSAKTAKKSDAKISVLADETKIVVIEAENLNDAEISTKVKSVKEGAENGRIAEPAPEDDFSPDTPEALVSNAILEEEVIDHNLDELINEIEQEKAAKKESPEKTAASKSQKAEAKEKLGDFITENPTEPAQEKSSGRDKKPKSKPASKKSESKAKPKVKAKPFRILSRLLALTTTSAVAAFAVRVFNTHAIPDKYFYAGVIVAAIILLLYTIKAFRNKTHVFTLVIFNLIGIVMTSASIFGFVKVNETMAFLTENLSDNKEYSVYNVIVNKKSSYTNLNDVRSKPFHSISDFVNVERLESAVKEQASSEIIYVDGISSLLDNALASNSYIALLNSGTYNAALEADISNAYRNNLKVIGEIKVEVEKKDSSVTSNLTTESFTVYVSGIDTRSDEMLDRSLSDVNIVITVNPTTKNILMTTVPRDYYVQLSGTSGLPDKLTHAGALGGLELSMSTIEDLLDIDFTRYVRVNFNFVINLVNAVGGITVYSDVDYDISAWTDRSCVFHPGNNELDGRCALAFARERYAYSDGDRHRGRNQEQVIEKIIDKVMKSSTLISHYSEVLNALSGSFDTNVTTTDITSLVNMQLSDMARWNIATYNLDGTTGMAYTYSYPGQKLSVMYPDETTVETARKKIQQVLAGTIDEPAPEDNLEDDETAEQSSSEQIYQDIVNARKSQAVN